MLRNFRPPKKGPGTGTDAPLGAMAAVADERRRRSPPAADAGQLRGPKWHTLSRALDEISSVCARSALVRVLLMTKRAPGCAGREIAMKRVASLVGICFVIAACGARGIVDPKGEGSGANGSPTPDSAAAGRPIPPTSSTGGSAETGNEA